MLVAATMLPGAAHAFHVFKVDPFCPDPSAYSTIQAAVNAAAAYSDADHADYVWISDNATINGYKNQHIVIDDRDGVIIEGGFFDCTDFDPGTDQTTVSGANNDGGPVIEIKGYSHVFLGNLAITGAQRNDGTCGGGISFAGQGDLTVQTTTVVNNHAQTGGGICMTYSFTGANADLSLKLLSNTQVAFNSAGDGGGIALLGSTFPYTDFKTTLLADAAGVWIAGNAASGFGGGMLMKLLAHADIGSPGLGDLGVLYDNEANNGGAIAMISATANGLGIGPTLNLYATDAAHPVRLRNNTAILAGGAIYMLPFENVASHNRAVVELSGRDFRIDENIAADGSALYGEPNGGVYVDLNASAFQTSACAPGVVCNSIDNNVTANNAGATDGATIVMQGEGTLAMHRVRLRGNAGGNVVHTIGSDILGAPEVTLSNAAITGNTTSSDLLKFAGPTYAGPIALVNLTVSSNSIASPNVVYAEHAIDVDASIFDQTGHTQVGYAGAQGGLQITDSIASEPASGAENFTVADPAFIDAGAGDYHLLPWSRGVDFARAPSISETAYSQRDLDGQNRTKDITSVPNAHAGFSDYRDAGAYELQFVCAADEVFCSGFEH